MRKTVLAYIVKCDSCARRKLEAPFGTLAEDSTPFEACAMDFVGPYPLSHSCNQYLISFIDQFTKYAELFTVPDQTVAACTKVFVIRIIVLLVGGIFCDWEKAFDCVDHDILLCNLNVYGIIGKDLALYHSYLDKRHFRTAVYNDSHNCNKVSSWVKVRHGYPQGFVLGPLLFLLCINDLPKFINKTSALIIYAEDTSISFAHSNLIEFNKNFYMVFATLNKWFRANQLSLNCNKYNYVHFTTKRNMSVNF
jgi:hypothetical protein